MTFARATTSIKDRVRISSAPSCLLVTISKRIRPAYLPRKVAFTHADGTEDKYFLVQSSNDARKSRPHLYPRSIAHNAVVLIGGLVDIPDEWTKNVGEIFTVNELAAKCKPAADALPVKTSSWCIAVLPVVFTFPGNEDTRYRGIVDEGCVDFSRASTRTRPSGPAISSTMSPHSNLPCWQATRRTRRPSESSFQPSPAWIAVSSQASPSSLAPCQLKRRRRRRRSKPPSRPLSPHSKPSQHPPATPRHRGASPRH